MDEATAHAMQYMALTDAMGYKSGAAALAPEEYAAALRKDAERYRWLRAGGAFVVRCKAATFHCGGHKVQAGTGGYEAAFDVGVDAGMQRTPAVG